MSENTLMTDTATNTDGASSTVANNASETSATPAPAPAEGAATEQQATDGQQTQDAATTAEGNDNQGNDGENKDTKPEVPEKYEFTMPDGVQMDDAAVNAYSEFAKEAGLTQEAAQNLMTKLAPVMQARMTESVQQARSAWEEASKADKEFGGDKLQENLAVAQKAMKAFGSPELRTLLNESGLGNHPEIIRVFYKAGKTISEDNFVPSGTKPQSGAKDPAKSLYPNQ